MTKPTAPSEDTTPIGGPVLVGRIRRSLLVVLFVGVLMLAATAGYISYARLPVTLASRDRVNDLRVIYSALREYAADNRGSRPSSVSELSDSGYLPGRREADRPLLSPEDGWGIRRYRPSATGRQLLLAYENPIMAVWVTAEGRVFMAKTWRGYILWPRHEIPAWRMRDD